MKVLICSQWFPPEKAVMVPDIATTLREKGHDVRVLTGFPNYPTGKIYDGWRQRPWSHEIYRGVPVKRVMLYPSHDRSAVRRALSYLSFALSATLFGWRWLRWADVVYVYHPPLTAALGPWVSRQLGGSPFVVHVQDLWPESVMASGMVGDLPRSRLARVLEWLCDAVYQGASRVVTIAPTMRTILVDRGVDAQRASVVFNWADEEIFNPVPASTAFRLEHGLASDAFVVMFAGNIGDVQGCDVAVRAASRVSDLDGFQLVFVGDGVALPALRQLVDELGATNIRFLPPQPLSAMNRVNSGADVHLVSLRPLDFLRGTIPSKIGTILASGQPLIASVDGDAAQLAEGSGAAWTCAAGDEDALQEAFRRAYGTPAERRAEMGRSGREYYVRNLSRDAGICGIEAALREAAHAHGWHQDERGD